MAPTSPPAADASAQGGPPRAAAAGARLRLHGRGPLPKRDVLHQMATAAYQPHGPHNIGGFILVDNTPTLKTYAMGNTMVVAVRGTVPTDPTDLAADALIVTNRLALSRRYTTDLAALKAVQARYSPTAYDYYGVGHSLGGAIIDEFIRAGLLKGAVTYNPAVQPQDFTRPTTNQRIYMSGDPLYATMGRFTRGAEVRATPKPARPSWLAPLLPWTAKAYDAYRNHALTNFVGGKRSDRGDEGGDDDRWADRAHTTRIVRARAAAF
jgi:hypothetical protein